MTTTHIHIKDWIRHLSIILFSIGTLTTGCKKFLDQKPNTSDIIPTTLNNLQTLLDNARGIVNSRGTGAYAELISDNIYLTTASWQSYASSSIARNVTQAQNYIWGDLPIDEYWSLIYAGPIYYSNIVLDQLPNIHTNAGEDENYKNLKGAALFYRAFAFHGLAQLYCKPYATDNANEPGIVLRLTSNVNNKSTRATVQQTYDQIIKDLNESADLLPTTTPYFTRPTKTAAYAALARVYLSMREYSKAGDYANRALLQNNNLINYNSLSATASPPISTQNVEVIFHNYSQTYTIINSGHKIDSTLLKSYNSNDLRKTIFYRQNTGADAGTYIFQGSYNGNLFTYSVFDGLATDELYLIRAECTARSGNKDSALADLNTLMIKRWRNGSWTPITATNVSEALAKILIERRKELVFRGLRWADIRRLNLEGENITLTRVIGGTNYSLLPTDLKSIMPIPLSEINNNPAVQQNPR